MPQLWVNESEHGCERPCMFLLTLAIEGAAIMPTVVLELVLFHITSGSQLAYVASNESGDVGELARHRAGAILYYEDCFYPNQAGRIPGAVLGGPLAPLVTRWGTIWGPSAKYLNFHHTDTLQLQWVPVPPHNCFQTGTRPENCPDILRTAGKSAEDRDVGVDIHHPLFSSPSPSPIPSSALCFFCGGGRLLCFTAGKEHY